MISCFPLMALFLLLPILYYRFKCNGRELCLLDRSVADYNNTCNRKYQSGRTRQEKEAEASFSIVACPYMGRELS
jgi:hypothetical protein